MLSVEKNIDGLQDRRRRFHELRTAVAAAAVPAVRRQLVSALAAAGIQLVAAPRDAAEALQALKALRPDLLVADAELPVMDGSALALRVRCSHILPVRPAAIVLRSPACPPVQERELLESGTVMLDKPFSAAGFAAAAEALRCAPPVFPAKEHLRADALLDALGVPEHCGRTCLKWAALLCAADERRLHGLGSRLYPEIACLCALEPAQVERALRRAISLAWQSDKFDNQYRIFADTVDARRGQPTCGEMISRLADILRTEG